MFFFVLLHCLKYSYPCVLQNYIHSLQAYKRVPYRVPLQNTTKNLHEQQKEQIQVIFYVLSK